MKKTATLCCKIFDRTGRIFFVVKCSMLVNIYARLSFCVKLGQSLGFFMISPYLCTPKNKTKRKNIMEYMSQEGYDELVAELQHMVKVELPAVRDTIAEARDKGDLSENFEYHAAKREQGKLLSRISFKQKILENARVIDKSRLQSDKVGLLSKVKITNVANKCSMTYTIVNPHEADLHSGKISIKSPIAQALLGKKAGDEVMVKVPAGLMKFHIDNVEL